MARQRREVRDIVATTAGTAIHRRKRPRDTVKPFARQLSRCTSMEQACDAQVANWVFIIKAWQTGQKTKRNNCLRHLFLRWLKPPSLTRSLPILAIKKPDLSHYACRSRHSLLFRLESGMGTLPRTCASHRRSCAQS